MRYQKKSIWTILVQKYSFNHATVRAAKQIADFIAITFLVLVCLIDWDMTLTNLGL